MRVISQNGLISVPFEMTAIHATGTFIRMNMVGDTGKGTIMAEYNTPGKAEKAMHILHETYSDMPVIFQNIEISDEEIPKIESMLKNVICVKIPDEPSKVEYINNVIFRFPTEEEL